MEQLELAVTHLYFKVIAIHGCSSVIGQLQIRDNTGVLYEDEPVSLNIGDSVALTADMFMKINLTV